MKHEVYYQQFLTKNPYPRSLKSLEVIQGFSTLYLKNKDKKIINFSSSDYLGLANHPLLIERAHAFANSYGTGAAASRLVSGNLPCYAELETQLARALKQPAALILGTGFQTNQSVLEALLHSSVLPAKPLVFCDKLCHVSMLTGIRTSPHFQRFRHNDFDHLQRLLEKYKDSPCPKFIMAESIYSMEGDQANLALLSQIAAENQAFLYVDDAHAFGVYGVDGWGMTPEYADHIAITMGTFSKALGGFGGFVGCSETLKEYLINQCRGLIYSTGLPPTVLGAISAAIELVPTLQAERQRLTAMSMQLRAFLQEEQLDYGISSTHIVPWIIGDAEKTLRASQLLEQEGIFAVGIQPPSVPVGKSRIRFCLSASHTDADLERLFQGIKKVKAQL